MIHNLDLSNFFFSHKNILLLAEENRPQASPHKGYSYNKLPSRITLSTLGGSGEVKHLASCHVSSNLGGSVPYGTCTKELEFLKLSTVRQDTNIKICKFSREKEWLDGLDEGPFLIKSLDARICHHACANGMYEA